jgi:hypothetical protein
VPAIALAATNGDPNAPPLDPLAIVGIVAASLLFAAILLLGILFIARRTLGKVNEVTTRRLEEMGVRATRQGPARSLGQTSLGKGQVRGSGTLALDGEELVFALAVPARTTRMPLASITTVDTTRSHLGKSVGSKLLRVSWNGEQGEDSIALQVPDLDGWIQAIETARQDA